MPYMISEIAGALDWGTLWSALLTLALGLLCWLVVKKIVHRAFSMLEKLGRALPGPEKVLKLFKSLLIFLFGTQLLRLFGVDISSLLAGLGIAGVVVGFAVQDVLKDVTMGINIMADRYYTVGDIISVGDIRNARVVSFNMKTTRLENLDTGDTITIANRNISEATVLSDWQMLDVPAPYEETGGRMRTVCEQLCERIRESETVSDCTFMGIQELGDSAVYYRLRITGDKDKRGAIRRYALGCVQEVYEREGISVPYPHMDVTQKNE